MGLHLGLALILVMTFALLALPGDALAHEQQALASSTGEDQAPDQDVEDSSSPDLTTEETIEETDTETDGEEIKTDSEANTNIDTNTDTETIAEEAGTKVDADADADTDPEEAETETGPNEESDHQEGEPEPEEKPASAQEEGTEPEPSPFAALQESDLTFVVPYKKTILSMGYQHRLQANITLAQSLLLHEKPFTILGAELLGMVTRHLSLGMAIHSVISDLHLPSGRDVFVSSTGILIRGYLFPRQVIHLTGGVLLGMGVAAPSKALQPFELPYFRWMTVAEPEIQLEVNITNTFKMGTRLSYVFYHGPYTGSDREDVKQHGVGGMTAGISLKWGIF